ncbi:CoA pyrophosphatase [Shewanella inventionis]|uniref:Coenzyme A pyrophosphatase n=1 Tax=Shewanella inventionis TaxID=1738770 RepID=A0ABQ1IRR4_9GAMM|nr:CoA pyrophosphatase [Shewanella inventionis]MCL1158927.1 CoA pyrophosphatase [Shewanella inventionis]UAL41891.1 CoA pyrophosphatase [Shewanella inventionis]GGB48721.1 coenzyme A pyrophosphatase [Shewanella inventionis]
MNKHEFTLRYKLHQLTTAITSAPSTYLGRKAAVLIPIIERDQQLHLLLTQRAMHLRHHPGQISFPGGKVEPYDTNAVETALREAQEEIGLMADNVEVLGVFPAHKTFTGFEITPVVALVKQPFELIIDPGEVADCFTVPLSFFIDNNNRHQVFHYRHGKRYHVHFMPFNDRFIWGVTAAIIDLLCRHVARR